MSSGIQILLGVVIAVALFCGWLALRRRRPAERRPVTPELDARLRGLVEDGKAIVAIKELRRATGIGLREAKEHVFGLVPEPGRRVTDRVQALLAEGRKIEAIRELRDATGWGLRETKEYVDALEVTGEPPAAQREELSLATMAQVRELVAAGRTIHAVKLVREDTGWGLKRAKDFVDSL